MSFVNNRERLFKSKSSTHQARKVTTGRMKTASSFTDPRAWSSDQRERASFIMDAMAEMASSSGGEDNGSDLVKKLAAAEQDIPELSWRRHKTMDYVDDSDHDLIKLNNKLFAAKEKIEELQTVNNNLLSEKTKTTAEVDNLRVLVTNMREQMTYLENLRTSNLTLRTEDELKTSRALEDAKLEIEHLTKEIEIYSEMCQSHADLRKVQENLVDEKKELSRTVTELRGEKNRLAEALKNREEDIAALEVQMRQQAQSSLDISILKEKITTKEETILDLTSTIQKQEMNVDELRETMSMMMERFKKKEDYLNLELKEVNKILDEKTARISQLETKLHETELLVAELEALRDQFRTTNITLSESVSAYKKDIQIAVNTSKELAETIRTLRFENDAKDREIEKLSLFPQNPDTMLYFSQLNKLVTSADNFYDLGPEDQADLMESIKKVIVKLKTEMWGSNVIPDELQIQDSSVQAEPEQSHSEIQCCPLTCSVKLQTCIPDEYFTMMHNRDQELSNLNLLVSQCEQRLSNQAAEFDSLETSLFDAVEENYSKDQLIATSLKNRELLEETLEVLNLELRNKDEMLANAMAEIHEQAENCKMLKGVLETAMQTTVGEYSEYVRVLEASLTYKDCEISKIKDDSEKTIFIQNATMEQITDHNKELRMGLEKEKQNNLVLNNQVSCLMKSLEEKIARTNDIEEKLKRAEQTIGKIVDNPEALGQGAAYSSGDYEKVENLYSQMTVYKSEMRKALAKTQQLGEEIERLRRSTKSMRITMAKDRALRQEKDGKILRMAMNLRKMTKRGMKLKQELSKRVIEKDEISDSLVEATAESDILKKERSVLLQELYAMKNRLSETVTSLEKLRAKEILHEELKMKMERMVLKLMKKVTKYKSEVNDRRDLEDKLKNHLVTNEQLYHEIDLLKNENLSLSTTICGFEQKLSTLMELPEKESSSVELQVSLEGHTVEQHHGFENSSHYEKVISSMKKDHATASEQSHRQYMSNLKVLRDTYERDMANLKASHSETLAKIQMLHVEELHQQSWKVDREKSQLERDHAEQLAGLAQKYETILKTREAEFEHEKDLLSEELSAVKSEFAEIHEETIVEIEKMKDTFKDQISQLEERQRIECELLKRQFDQEIESEVGKRIDEMKTPTTDRTTQCCRAESADSGTDPDVSIQKESSTNTDNLDTAIVIACNVARFQQQNPSLFPSSTCGMEMLPAFPDRFFLMSRIGELEKSLQMQHSETTRKIKFLEKRLKHEQMKAKEIAHILDQELRYSTDVHCKLGLQYNRAEQLELEKDTLATRVLLYERQLELLKKGEPSEHRPAIAIEGLVDAERELEISLNRLKEKIDLAVEQEKRISATGRPNYLPADNGRDGTDEIPHKEFSKPPGADVSGDMEVIVIQQHKVTHAWSSQIDNVYS